MGLSEVSPREWAAQVGSLFSNNDLTYYIDVRDQSLAQKIMKKDKGGAEQDTGEGLQVTGNNADTDDNSIDIRVQDGQIVFDLFKRDAAAVVNLATFTLANKRQTLYPFLILRGSDTTMSLQNIKIMVDPFENDLTPYLGCLLYTSPSPRD